MAGDVLLQHLNDGSDLVGRQGRVEQSGNGTPNQLQAGPNDMQGHADRQQRIQNFPAGHTQTFRQTQTGFEPVAH